MPLYPEFERMYVSDVPAGRPIRWLPMRGHEVLVRASGEGAEVIVGDDAARQTLDGSAFLVLGSLDGALYVTCEAAPDMPLPQNWRASDLRKLYGQIPDGEWQIAGYAAQILHWQRVSGFCPVCGSATEPMGKEWVRHCSACGHDRYPNVSPAVLALVHDGADRVLLAHKPGWGDRYSILAGFVLPGESLEECVQREVEEEVGVQVADITYKGSQTWPFPHQLMVGFTARYISGAIRLDEEELDHAAWFDVRELPTLPPPLSLSRQLLDAWQRERLEKLSK